MITRKTYTTLSSECLEKYQDIALCDILHHLQAYLLYPPNCACKDTCLCDSLRKKIVFSLNVDFYNQALKNKESGEKLRMMKFLWEIPDMSFFRKNYTKAYPSWLIYSELKKREEEHIFKSIEHLVWMILRLAETYQISAFRQPWTSIKRAIQLILGKNKKRENKTYFCGEKAYAQRLRDYRPICHFITAMEYMKKDHSLMTADQIRELLSTAEAIKEALLFVETTNVKNDHIFVEKNFFSLPHWLQLDEVPISIEPLEDKLQEINEMLECEYKKQQGLLPDYQGWKSPFSS